MLILTLDYQADDAPTKFCWSLKNTGFAVITNHPIDLALFQQVKADWQQFFACDDKLNYSYDKKADAQGGYFPTESAKGQVVDDLKEFYQIYPHSRIPKNIGSATWQLYQQLLAMGLTLLQWLQDYTPSSITKSFSLPLTEMVDVNEHTLLRIIHYPPQQGGNKGNAIRAAAHGDINLMTILPASDEPGLQAKDSQGNWCAVPCDPGMMVINAGDMLAMCSNYYYTSTIHRVCNPKHSRKHRSRYSFPLFLHPKKEVILDIKSGFRAHDYLMQRLKELGLK